MVAPGIIRALLRSSTRRDTLIVSILLGRRICSRWGGSLSAHFRNRSRGSPPDMGDARQAGFSRPPLVLILACVAVGVVILTVVGREPPQGRPPTPQEIHAFVETMCKNLPQAQDSEAIRYAPLCALEESSRREVESKDLDVYIDGSESMRGFAVPNDSNFRALVGDLLEASSTASFNLNEYKFTSAITGINGMPVSEILNPAFYNGLDTPLADLVARIAATPGHTAIIVSDLVQSERGRDWQALALAFSHLAETRPQIRLLAFRSGFEGNYFPEFRTGSEHSPRLLFRLSQDVPGAGRPFYMVVVAPDSESMQFIEQYVLRRVKPVEVYDPATPPIEIHDLKLTDGARIPDDVGPEVIAKPRADVDSGESQQDGSSPPWQAARHLQQAHDSHWLYSYFYWTGFGPQGDTVPLPVDLSLAETLPLHDPSGLSMSGVRMVWDGSQFTRSDGTPLVPVKKSAARPDRLSYAEKDQQVSQQQNMAAKPPEILLPDRMELASKGWFEVSPDDRRHTGVLRLAVKVLRPRKRSWDVYVIPLRAGNGNLDPPPWIADWSTDNDSQADRGNRTFQLRAIADCMVHAISEKSVVGIWSLVTTQGGD